jgi:hypothetical protein
MRLILFISVFLQIFNSDLAAQSLNEDKTAAINFVKRVFNSAPFEGVKVIEGDQRNYYLVAVKMPKSRDNLNTTELNVLNKKIEDLTIAGFNEPCVNYEQIQEITNVESKSFTYLYLCETASSYIIEVFKKVPFQEARILVTNSSKYVVSVVTLDDTKYSNPATKERVAQMKAKQQINSLLNGSIIESEVIINTSNTQKSEFEIAESIRESSMGFINGIELLKTITIKPNQTTYFYYSKI